MVVVVSGEGEIGGEAEDVVGWWRYGGGDDSGGLSAATGGVMD